MSVIAMTREMGSLGRDVALGLADRLDLKLVQHELVEHVADKMHLKESAVNRFLEGKAGLLERWGIDENDLSLFTKEEILEVAGEGNVLIRGWGASYVLRSIPHVLCVRVCAPLKFRAHVLMKRIGIDDFALAQREIEKNDAAHVRTMSSMFHIDYTDPILYDIVLNSEKLSIDKSIDVLQDVLTQPIFKETSESRAKVADLHLEAKIQSALGTHKVTAHSSPSFEVKLESGTGHVILDGIAYDQEFKDTAERLVRAIPEVKNVRNDLRLIRYAGP